jgi:hypothetical protein
LGILNLNWLKNKVSVNLHPSSRPLPVEGELRSRLFVLACWCMGD